MRRPRPSLRRPSRRWRSGSRSSSSCPSRGSSPRTNTPSGRPRFSRSCSPGRSAAKRRRASAEELMRTLPLTLALAVPLMGCAHSSDVELRDPLAAGAVDINRIVKPHDYIENHRGLPRGSVADEAMLVSVDAQQICFGLTMHELDPIDFGEMEVELKTPDGAALAEARVEP